MATQPDTKGHFGPYGGKFVPEILMAPLEELERAKARGTELKLKPVEAGAATQVYAATAPELEGRGGIYLEDCHVAEVDDAENAPGGVRSFAVDPGNARRLWTVSEELVGQSFPL